MAKMVNTSKKLLLQLYNVWELMPSSKIGGENAKYVEFRKNLYKPLKEYLEKTSDLRAKQEKLRKDLDKEVQPFRDALEAALEENKEEAKIVLTKKVIQVNKQLEPFNVEIEEVEKLITSDNVKVTFDNEGFNFFGKVLKENGAELFCIEINKGTPEKPVFEKRVNGEALTKAFDFYDAAKNE